MTLDRVILGDHEQIAAVARRLAAATTKGELGSILADEAGHYTIADLQTLGGRLFVEMNRLPSPYREQVRPYITDQLFGAHHMLVLRHREGQFRTLTEPIRDQKTFHDFCAMLPDGCFARDETAERTPFPFFPRHRLFYYLMAAFTIFVLDRPGHPVGMPFPGGFFVEDRNGTYYCLIRDREKEVFFSICNFCPAKQTEENAMPERR
jgi:uncharacterized protein (UPF0305 family)